MIVDRYQLKMLSICQRCKKKNNAVPHSCEAYPKRDGISPELWNAKRFDCEYFDEKEEFKKNLSSEEKGR